MVTVKNTDIDAFAETDALQTLYGVESEVVYQKAMAKRIVTQEEISEELQAMGGLENASSQYVSAVRDAWLVNATLVIMDDTSFLAYCEQIKTEPRLDGVVILNQTRDANDPNFHDRRSLLYLAENGHTTMLRQVGDEDVSVEMPVLAYTRQVPVLREEYGALDFYELVHFIPLSVWKEMKGQIGGAEADTYIRILTRDGVTLDELNEVGEKVSILLILIRWFSSAKRRLYRFCYLSWLSSALLPWPITLAQKSAWEQSDRFFAGRYNNIDITLSFAPVNV